MTECDEHFRHLCPKLDPHEPMLSEMSAAAYGFNIEKGNLGVYQDLVR